MCLRDWSRLNSSDGHAQADCAGLPGIRTQGFQYETVTGVHWNECGPVMAMLTFETNVNPFRRSCGFLFTSSV